MPRQASPGARGMPRRPAATDGLTDFKNEPDMSLSPAELERYARHIVLQDVGGPGSRN
jgi:hypothetical protein